MENRVRGGLIAVTSLSFLAAGSALANEEIRMLGNCADCVLADSDFSGERLIGLDLTDAHVRDVDFSQGRLSIAVFDGARLSEVSFRGADLRGASFVNARLVDVDFYGADLTGAVFDGAELQDSALERGRLCQTQLPGDVMATEGCDDE